MEDSAASRFADLANVVLRFRKRLGFAQDDFGARYSITGPAIHKIENGTVRPSLELWMCISADAGVSENRAVLMWIRSRLPEEYRDWIPEEPAISKSASFDFCAEGLKRSQVRTLIEKAPQIGKELKDFLLDPSVWDEFVPTPQEIRRFLMIDDVFGPLPEFSLSETLLLIRRFRMS